MTLNTRNLFNRITLAFLLILAAAFPALAADEVQNNPDTGKPFANVWRLRGDVFVTSKLGVPRRLREGSTVFVGEQVRAAPNSEAVLKTGDSGIVAVRPGAEFVPERFAAEGKSTDRQILRLITGSLRVITGWIGQLNRNDHRIITPRPPSVFAVPTMNPMFCRVHGQRQLSSGNLRQGQSRRDAA
ncbi:MAG: hypothetical protein IPJ38_16485 [Dechloromonas sp.]|uniref:FecR protein domain-containing protein n=1 Tax=Candidatus Dechloromonas phosphorivorans TaxID=2899244 RepID=A0A935N283_9RHOO|nr:hypothetical protein [Candidatus Dechloromonas phosphorivorans]